ncbi:discoidin domain-containing protein [Paenibacillus mendelii]|uniref:Discoidin domain-containing protein n=1 Tax=Paenibacillus mendelii TaxID=206163 RepID=A0ABV6JJG2_9BACL|nr:discoidin domain-containing protein [Paenibacillus mendelii]MCQ6558753.1 discoidin domain-containing protein [Paenibacillus mendelii]
MRKKSIATLVVIVSLVLILGVKVSTSLAADYSVDQWRVAEISLTSSKTYADPFNDVDVTAEFAGPGGAVISRPAFWDGGNTWKVRFAPVATGLWTMTTTSSDPTDGGLHNITRTIESRPYVGSHEIYKRGFLSKSNDGRYLTYADGSPFFYLGDTHWIMPHERFETSNVDGVPSQFKYTVDKRVSQGFTVYQSQAIWQPHGGGDHAENNEEEVANLSDGFSSADLAGFHNLDRKFAYIADQGLVHSNSQISWVGDPVNYPNVYTEAYMARVAKYWVARYGAYPVIWTIGQEIDKNLYGAYNAATIGKWFAAGNGIEDNDDYNHLIMPHMEGTGATTASDSWWADKSYHDGWAVQMHVDMTDMNAAKDFWNTAPHKPAVLYETGYEKFWADSKGALGAAYKAFQYGIYGYGYGAAGVWNDVYSKPGEPDDFGTAYELPQRYYWWYDGANLRTADQLGFFKRFYTALEWWKLVPRFDSSTWGSFTDPSHTLLSSDGSDTYVVYFFGEGQSTGVIKNMSATASYTAKWYDPRNGEYINLDTFTPAGGQWTVPNRPSAGEWLLIVSNKPIADNEGDTNQSAYKSVTVSSSSPGHDGSLALDGLYDTHWIASSGTVPQWLMVDMGAIKNISGIETSFYLSNRWKYKLEGSVDQSNWSTIADHTSAGVLAQHTTDSASGAYRYVKITITGFDGQTMAAIGEFRVLGTEALSLLSQHKTVSASSDNGPGCNGAKAVDGDHTTYWCAADGSKPQWMTVDLGAMSKLEKITTSFYALDSWKYKIEGSTDNGNWTMLVDKTAAGVTNQIANDSVSGVFRYVKITITDAVNWGAIREFEIYGKTNAASGKTATVSTNNGAACSGAMALDGDDSTYWCAADGTKPQWLHVDLGTSHKMNEVITKFYAIDSWKYKVEGSLDNSTWTTLADHTGSGINGQITSDPVSGSYRYVRITITGSVNWAAIRELQLFG